MTNCDLEIVEGIRKKDENSFNKLIDVYGGLIKAIVIRHMSQFREYQEECINDILLSLWQNMKSYDENKNSLKNWIGAVSKYKAIDYKRRYYKNFMYNELDENIPDTKSETAFEIQEEIESILSCLPEKDREIFYRHYIIGEKISDIAKSQKKSPALLFNRMSRGRAKIRKAFKGASYNEK